MRSTKHLSISDVARVLHFEGSGGTGVILYPRDPRAHGVQWVHMVPHKFLPHGFIRMRFGPPILTGPVIGLGLAKVPQGIVKIL